MLWCISNSLECLMVNVYCSERPLDHLVLSLCRRFQIDSLWYSAHAHEQMRATKARPGSHLGLLETGESGGILHISIGSAFNLHAISVCIVLARSVQCIAAVGRNLCHIAFGWGICWQ